MRNLGYGLTLIGFAGALAASHFESFPALIVAFTLLVGGFLLVLINGAICLYRGEVSLRPIDALKRAALIFLVVFAVRQLVSLIFPNPEKDIFEEIFASSVFAVALGFYTTAYRKPA